MNLRSISLKSVFILLLALAAPRLWAQDGIKGALSQSNFATSLERSLAVADFDNDQRPDGAVLLHPNGLRPQSSFRIELHLTGNKNTELSFESSQTALELVAFDIDHDGDTDVIVQQAFTHERLHVWINDGEGAFHEGRLQDFSSIEVATGESLNAPSRQPYAPVLALCTQRGFEVAVLTTPLLSRPPTTPQPQRFATEFSVESPSCPSNLSRAPPLI
jgi:hypothetical protein